MIIAVFTGVRVTKILLSQDFKYFIKSKYISIIKIQKYGLKNDKVGKLSSKTSKFFKYKAHNYGYPVSMTSRSIFQFLITIIICNMNRNIIYI